MPWFKVDDGFATSRQILAIPPRYRLKAAGLWTLAGTWSAKELTDGQIPHHVAKELGGTQIIIDWLIKVGLWEWTETSCNFVHWSEFQFTKSRVMEHRANEAERKKRARQRKETHRQNRLDQQIVDDVPPGLRAESRWDSGRNPGGVRPESALPDQTRPDPIPISTYVGGDVTQVEPPARCPAHTTHLDPPPCRACADARRINTDWHKQRAAEREHAQAANRAAIEACPDCDDKGLIEIDDDHLARCDHTAVIHA